MQDIVGSARVQLCGAFAVELSGRRVDKALPGRQGRLLFAYLAVSLQPVQRETLVDVLWGDSPPAGAAAALNVLISKVRAAVGPGLLRGRTELSMTLPHPTYVDVEVAKSRTAWRRVHAGAAGNDSRAPPAWRGERARECPN